MAKPLFFDGDIGNTLVFTVLDADRQAFDLTGASVDLLVEDLGSFTCTVTDATGGVCEKTVTAGEFPSGTYRAHLRATISGTQLHSGIFVIQVAQVVDYTSPPAPVSAPGGNPTQGAIPFGNTGGGSYAEDPSGLSYDASKDALLIGGATAGSGGDNIIALKVGAVPATNAADQIQLVAANINGGDTASPLFKIETGGGLKLDDGTNILVITVGTECEITPGGGALFLESDTTNLGNFIIGAQGTTPSATLDKGFVQTIGTAATTFPADMIQGWVSDLNGAGTAGWTLADETGHSTQFGRVVGVPVGNATDKAASGGGLSANVGTVGTPANTTETALHTLTIPANALVTNGQGVRFYYTGTMAANGNNKTVRLRLGTIGGTAHVSSGTVATNNADWVLNGTLTRTAANTAVIEARCLVGPAGAADGANSVHRINIDHALNFDMTASYALILSGQNGSASANDVTATVSKLIYESL